MTVTHSSECFGSMPSGVSAVPQGCFEPAGHP